MEMKRMMYIDNQKVPMIYKPIMIELFDQIQPVRNIPKEAEIMNPPEILDNFDDMDSFYTVLVTTDAKQCPLADMFAQCNVLEVAINPTTSSIAIQMMETLATLDIENEKMIVRPSFHPHSREFFEIRECLDCTYQGMIIQDWKFPDMGAEKLSKNKLKTMGVEGVGGVIAATNIGHVVDAAREKLDGVEVVTFGIRVNNEWKHIQWDDKEIKFVQDTCVSLCERVGNQLYVLSGSKFNALIHPWEYLSRQLCDDVQEGLIIRMNGKEYRVPRFLSSTFEVRLGDDHCYDNKNKIVQVVKPKNVEPGFYDFLYSDSQWVLGKRRDDKLRADSYNSAVNMISDSATVSDLLSEVIIPFTRRQLVIGNSKIVFHGPSLTTKERVAVFQIYDEDHVIFINKTAASGTDSTMYQMFAGNIMSGRKNLIRISGMESKVPRCNFKPFVDRQRNYLYTDKPMGHGISKIRYCYNERDTSKYVKVGNVNALRCYRTKLQYIINKVKMYEVLVDRGKCIEIKAN